MTRRLHILAAALLLALVAAPSASADFAIERFGAEVANQDGSPATAAGAHPFRAMTTFELSTVPAPGLPLPDGQMKDAVVDLPPGFVGNPLATPRCQRVDWEAQRCRGNSQVGVARVQFTYASPETPIYNLVPPPGMPAQFAFRVGNLTVHLDSELRTDSDNGVTVASRNTPQTLPTIGATVTLWGVPASPAHDGDRGPCMYDDVNLCPSGAEPIPLLTTPMDCSAGLLTTTFSVDQWANPGVFEVAAVDHDVNGVPMAVDGCEHVPFDPAIDVAPTSTAPDSPTGLAVDLSLPQEGLLSPTGVATAHLRRVTMTLPEGMTINPSSAAGLAACADAELGIGTRRSSACADRAKIGTVVVETPLLEEPLNGGVYIRPQASDDPESGDLFRLAITLVDEERGIRIKLPGRVRANSATGRLEATFDDNPQLPVSRIALRLKDGPRAPLATPSSCGPKTIDVELTSWSGHAVDLTDELTVGCGGGAGFSPSFEAGTLQPVAGEFSPFAARIARGDGQQFLSGVSVDMPEGLLAKLRGVPLCGSAAAESGGCPAGSRVGTATVAAGSGSNPYLLQGDAFLTEGYKGAPYGLVVHVHAKAGPFDLGWVRVRQALHVDPVTTRVSVVSDPLPRIVKGVPVRLRSVDVTVDRPDFTVNPTSCAAKQVAATLTSVDGASRRVADRFQAADCARLGFKPRLAMRLLGKGRTKTGAHPALRAVLTQGAGQANVDRAEVTLPRSVVLDPRNSTDPRLLCGYDEGLRASCPASSVVGTATASTPLLNRPLTGKVHLVQGIRFGPSGNRIRTTPSLLVKLRGEVAIDLRARTTVKRSRLVTTFPDVPDARVSKFSMTVKGGRKGILVITRTRRARIDVCDRRQVAEVETDGHNGKRADFRATLRTPCRKRKRS